MQRQCLLCWKRRFKLLISRAHGQFATASVAFGRFPSLFSYHILFVLCHTVATGVGVGWSGGGQGDECSGLQTHQMSVNAVGNDSIFLLHLLAAQLVDSTFYNSNNFQSVIVFLCINQVTDQSRSIVVFTYYIYDMSRNLSSLDDILRP